MRLNRLSLGFQGQSPWLNLEDRSICEVAKSRDRRTACNSPDQIKGPWWPKRPADIGGYLPRSTCSHRRAALSYLVSAGIARVCLQLFNLACVIFDVKRAGHKPLIAVHRTEQSMRRKVAAQFFVCHAG